MGEECTLPDEDDTTAKVKAGSAPDLTNVQVGQEKLQSGLDYACGEGGANCGPIQSGEACFNPDTLEAHASYAFNSYYQKMSRASGTCDFGGAAHVVTQLPKVGNCEYPTTRG